MASWSGQQGWPLALCAMHAADRTTDFPGAPVRPHDHPRCPVCQSHSVPLGILIGAMLLFSVTTRWRRWIWTALATPAPTRPFRLYASRAPPVAA